MPADDSVGQLHFVCELLIPRGESVIVPGNQHSPRLSPAALGVGCRPGGCPRPATPAFAQACRWLWGDRGHHGTGTGGRVCQVHRAGWHQWFQWIAWGSEERSWSLGSPVSMATPLPWSHTVPIILDQTQAYRGFPFSSASCILDSWELRSLGFQSTPWVALPYLKLSCHSLSCLGQWFQRLLLG